ncbi:GreA/GreB family elongation factor [Actinocatenispora sera]|uniref:Transcription elongation factor GreA n=1 Tax=Actinocatenispora sera TaxID=390989 RepID=A0A810L246_9ACTN|nr:GreA/GreB family elongation factor [Actinocatenispora sera]BCJ28526.1 transcription elongation factor GreA [Actinocatenispora sera]
MTTEASTLQHLREELATAHRQRQQVADTLTDRLCGDAADQAEGVERVNELRRLDLRIAQLERLLVDATRADPGEAGTLPFGTRLVLRFADGDTERVHLAPVPATSATGTAITRDSPLAQALLGRSVGDTVTWSTPAGELRAELLELHLP